MQFIITTKGKELITNLVAGIETCKFYRVVVSDDDIGSDEEVIKALTAINIKQFSEDLQVSKLDNQSTVHIETTITNKELTEGYTAKSVAVIAKNKSGEDILYAAAKIADQFIPAGNSSFISGLELDLFISLGLDNNNINITLPGSMEVSVDMLNEHTDKKVSNENGVHDIRYWNEKLEIKDGDTWKVAVDISVHDDLHNQLKDDITNLKGINVNNEEGANGLRYKEGHFEINSESGWVVAGEDNEFVSKAEYSNFTQSKVGGEDGVHGLRYHNDKLQIRNELDQWKDVVLQQEQEENPIDHALELSKHKSENVLNPSGVHGLRLHNKKLQALLEGSWTNLFQGISNDEFNTFKNSSIRVKDGIHGIRYLNNNFQINNGTYWETLLDGYVKSDQMTASIDNSIDIFKTTQVTTEQGLHGLRFHNKKLQVYEEDKWKDIINTNVGGAPGSVIEHAQNVVTNDNGVHGLRYANNRLEVLREGIWVQAVVIPDGVSKTVFDLYTQKEVVSSSGVHSFRIHEGMIQRRVIDEWKNVALKTENIEDLKTEVTKLSKPVTELNEEFNPFFTNTDLSATGYNGDMQKLVKFLLEKVMDLYKIVNPELDKWNKHFFE